MGIKRSDENQLNNDSEKITQDEPSAKNELLQRLRSKISGTMIWRDDLEHDESDGKQHQFVRWRSCDALKEVAQVETKEQRRENRPFDEEEADNFDYNVGFLRVDLLNDANSDLRDALEQKQER